MCIEDCWVCQDRTSCWNIREERVLEGKMNTIERRWFEVND